MLGAIILFIIAVFLLCAGIRLSLERGFLIDLALKSTVNSNWANNEKMLSDVLFTEGIIEYEI